MAGPHDELLTAAEHEAAQLLVTLAWRLDGGQLISADQLLARLCAIPANDIAMASIVLLRQVVHGVAPELRRPRPRSLATLVVGSPAGIRRQASVGRRASRAPGVAAAVGRRGVTVPSRASARMCSSRARSEFLHPTGLRVASRR